jgi:hypothetical protein
LFENDPPPPEKRNEVISFFGELSAELGKFKNLLYLRELPDFTWTKAITLQAAKGGHVDILDYVWDNGLPINLLKVCEATAKGTEFEEPWNEKNLLVLKWARKKQATWDFFQKSWPPKLVEDKITKF